MNDEVQDANAPIKGTAFGVPFDGVHVSKEEIEAGGLGTPPGGAVDFVSTEPLYQEAPPMAVDTEVTTVADPQRIDPVTLEPAINTIITESKVGYKTTEFWVSVAVALFATIDPASLPDWAQTALIGVAAAAYAISRGLAKQGVPAVVTEEVPPAPPA